MPMCRQPLGFLLHPGERVKVGDCGMGTVQRDPGPASHTVDVFIDDLGQTVPVARVLLRISTLRLAIDNTSGDAPCDVEK
jgi:hypothetical protein